MLTITFDSAPRVPDVDLVVVVGTEFNSLAQVLHEGRTSPSRTCLADVALVVGAPLPIAVPTVAAWRMVAFLPNWDRPS